MSKKGGSEMLFIIRDDDTSFFTQSKDIISAYGPLWGEIPITLAVIPYDVPTYNRGIPKTFYQETKPVSIEGNYPLIDEINEGIRQNYLQVMLHGYNHLYKVIRPVPYDSKYWIPEFQYTDRMTEKIKAGKNLLEKVFHTNISFFVPPSNTLSTEGIKAVATEGLNLAGLSSVKKLIMVDPRNLGYLVSNRLQSEYPYNIRQFTDHKEILCHPLTPVCDWERLSTHLNCCAKKNGTFVLATHYWELDRFHQQLNIPLKELLFELVKRAQNFGADFVNMNALIGRR
ncbi:MAG TPA: hypothetical protein DCX03_07665 [Bacteroidales bacterium]|nr:hypothetical protein [Bacteroidales bacterium]